MNSRSGSPRSEEHTSELQSREKLVCRLLLEKKKKTSLSVSLPQITLLQPKISALVTAVPCLKVFPPLASARRTTISPDPVQPIFFFNDTATTEIYTLSLHDALPI